MERRNDIIVGLFVLVGIAVAILGGIWLEGGKWRRQGEMIQARFHTVGQLEEGNKVVYRGVTVGVVEGVRLLNDGTVAVTMRIRPGVQVPDSVVAVISAASLFGDWEASLVGAGSYPSAAAGYPDLRPGEIPGVTMPQFSQLTEHTARIAENLAGITDRLDRALSQQTADEFAAAVRNVNRATADLATFLQEQREAFTDFSTDMQAAGGSVREAADALDVSLARVDSATGEGRLTGLMSDARASAANLRELTAQWSDAGVRFNATLERADSSMNAVQEILARIERGEGTLGLLSADTVLYENTAATIAELRALLDELKTNPDRYFRFSIF